MNRRDPKSRFVKLTLLSTSTLIVMVTGVIVPALPALQDQFAGVRGAALLVRLVVTLPSALIVVTAPVAGYVVDRVGRKRVVVISILVFGISGVAGYLVPSLAWLLASRAMLGIAVGALMTSVTTLIADYYIGPARGRFLGLQAAFMGFGGTASLALGGILAEAGWRTPFLAYSVAFAMLPPAVIALYEPAVSEQCIEKVAPLAGPGVCVAESLLARGSLAGSKAEASSVPGGLLLLVYPLVVAIQIILFLLPMQLPFHLRQLMAAGAARSGLAIGVMSVFYALASMSYGRLAKRLDHPEVLVLAIGLIGVGYLLIWSASGWGSTVSGLVVAGTGQGLLSPNLSVWLADETPRSKRGRVLGGLTTAIFLGVFISPIVGQPLVEAIGFRRLCLGIGCLLAVTAISFWTVRHLLRCLTDCRTPAAEGSLVE